jgi:ADP-heptose:LPS heptosyltransferase/GT2 family glycosyltransferase
VRYPSWDIQLVDQSDDPRTREVVAGFAELRSRLTYRHQTQQGLSVGRNEGIAAACGEIIAFLDDDCTVDSNWLTAVADAFHRHPEAAAIYGTVRSTIDDIRYYVPTYEARAERVLKGRLAMLEGAGIGAAMYARRSALDRVGAFDIHLGAGSRFRSGEDLDYTYRILADGLAIATTPTITVDHFGGRRFENGDASRLWRNIAYSEGTLHMKLLRCGDPIAVVLMATRIWRNIFVVRPLNLLLRRGNSHLARLPMYLWGLLASFELSVDRKRYLYTTDAERSAKMRDRAPVSTILLMVDCHSGDGLRISPYLQAVRTKYPTAKIDLLVSEGAFPVFQNSGWFDRIIVSRLYGAHPDGPGASPKRWTRLRKAAELGRLAWSVRRRFDLVIVFWAGTTALHVLARVLGRGARVGYARRYPRLLTSRLGTFDGLKNGLSQQLALLQAAGIPSIDRRPPGMEFSLTELEAVRGMLRERGYSSERSLVVLHPGSDWACQQWLPSRWADLANAISARYVGTVIAFTGSSRETPYVQRIRQAMTAPSISLAGQTSLSQLAALLSLSRLCICVDNVVFVLTQAAGVPAVVLAGPSDADVVVTGDRLPNIVNRTSAPLKLAINQCREPKTVLGGCLNYDCSMAGLRDISVDDVLEAVEAQSVLTRREGRRSLRVGLSG